MCDPALKQPLETAPHDGTVIQIGGPYEWIVCHWVGDAFVTYASGERSDGRTFVQSKTAKFWRPYRER